MDSVHGPSGYSPTNYFARIIAAFGLLAAMASASAFGAGDVWRDKGYADWTYDDVRAIQSESPWAKKIAKDAPWIEGTPTYMSASWPGCDGRMYRPKGNQIPPQLAMGLLTSLVEYNVSWISSQTMRSAKMRESVICGVVNEERADDFLEQEVDQYQIRINAPDMKPFESLDEEAIKANTRLIFKKGKREIAPISAIPQRGGPNRIVSITFTFEKEDEAGAPYLVPDEREILFVSKSGKFSLKAKFDPSKMAGKNGPDL